MSKKVNEKWKKTFPDAIGNQNRPVNGVDDTQPFETGAFPQYIANDPVRYDLQNAAMSQSMSNDARLKEMVDARGKELDDHKVDPGAHKTGIAGNAATATKVVTTAATGASANIAEASMGGSDSARIRVSGAENAGELALETANDGDEAIVARQYTGVYTNAVRTAKILDESGNTSFPGTVVAPKFTGTLNGNAATASKLATPRALSLTGKAAGSTTFDGSANASINVTSVNADTATKLSTARKINITGNASGSGTFDGSGDISINTMVSQATNADTVDGYHASDLLDKIYPVGSIYMSMSATNPATLFGVGTWQRISQGRMLLGADDSTYKAGATGGEATHTLTVNEMPAHSHTGTTSTNGEHSHSASWLYAWSGSDTWNYFAKSYSDNPGTASGGSFTIGNAGNHDHTFTTNNTGGGAAHNNMPPYLVCYIWQRTA